MVEGIPPGLEGQGAKGESSLGEKESKPQG